MGNGTTCSELEGLITYDDHTTVMSPRPFCHFIMKIVTGNEKRVTRVRIMCPHIQILNLQIYVWEPLLQGLQANTG